MKLKTKILIFAILPLLFTGNIAMAVATTLITNAITGQIQDSLRATSYVYREAIGDEDGNNYWINENGDFMNGDYNVTQDTALVDYLFNESEISLSVIYGNKRVATSLLDTAGKRLVGTEVSQTVADTVLAGNEFFSPKVVIDNVEYLGYYVPLYNGSDSMGNGGKDEVIGIIFAGTPYSVLNRMKGQAINGIVLSITILFIIFILVDRPLAKGMAKRFEDCADMINTVSGGDLTVEVSPKLLKNKDESGDIARSIQNMKEKYVEAIGSIIAQSDEVNRTATTLDAASEECANTIGQVEIAVQEIANGATSQANDTTDASEQVIAMGNLVEETNDSVSALTSLSDKMEKSGVSAKNTLDKLNGINAEAKAAIDIIYEQTNTTNTSVQKISEAVNIITSIAEETNLLSLNASIEAARAGEQGRGFAVVASQIQSLADQSANSAKTIENIIVRLMEDSKKSVETMNEVKEIMERQSSMVGETEEAFKEVMDGIDESREGISVISANMDNLNNKREIVVDIVQSLSAIAEENAAGTEETSASTNEVSASVQEVAASAITLKDISDKLNDAVNNFKI